MMEKTELSSFGWKKNPEQAKKPNFGQFFTFSHFFVFFGT